jgi:hypothetical protein
MKEILQILNIILFNFKYINVRENRKDNHEWAIFGKQDMKQNKKTNGKIQYRKIKR